MHPTKGAYSIFSPYKKNYYGARTKYHTKVLAFSRLRLLCGALIQNFTSIFTHTKKLLYFSHTKITMYFSHDTKLLCILTTQIYYVVHTKLYMHFFTM